MRLPLFASIVVLSLIVGLFPLGGQQYSHGQSPPIGLPDGGSSPDEAALKHPESTPPKEVAYWVSQLGHEHFLRRQKASQELKKMGPAILPELAAAMDVGDLEVIERSIVVISGFALSFAPAEDGGAWHMLQAMASKSVGRRALAARSAMEEVRELRSEQAARVLTAAGVFIGERYFSIAASQNMLNIVEIGNTWSGDVKTLQWLEWIDDASHVRVTGKALRGDVLSNVVKMPRLEAIAMTDAEAGVADEVFSSLAAMSRIESLDIRYVALTAQQGEIISQLPIRTSLTLMGTGIEADAVEKIRTRLAGLEIQYRQGGFLGVSCYPGEQICRINVVHENTAAFEAGLLFGDVVVGVGGSDIGSFKDLQSVVNRHSAGDEVEIRYLRAGKLLRVKVRLKRLEEN